MGEGRLKDREVASASKVFSPVRHLRPMPTIYMNGIEALKHAGRPVVFSPCAAEFGPAMERLASAYEADNALRQDLLQEIHAALWRSLHRFDNRCALRTWVYRVAHNTAASHVRCAIRHDWVSLEEAQSLSCSHDPDRRIGARTPDGSDPSAPPARPPSHPALSRRPRRNLHRRDHGPLRRQRRHQDPPRQEHPHSPLPRRRTTPCNPRNPSRMAIPAIANEPADSRAPAPEGAPV